MDEEPTTNSQDFSNELPRQAVATNTAPAEVTAEKPVATPVQPAQPVQQWQQTPPQSADVQYVVAQKSLDGIGGWLAFWLVVFALSTIGYVMTFFNQLNVGVSSTSQVVSVIFSPILAVAYLASAVLIALRKKLGIMVSMGAIGLATVYSIINTVIVASSDSASLPMSMSGIVVTVVIGGLMALYFYSSKRVKATLVK